MKITVKDGMMSITDVDVSEAACKAAAPSKSGKTKLVAGSGGFVPVPGRPDLKVSLNVTTRAKNAD
jgi:hypothetical protein